VSQSEPDRFYFYHHFSSCQNEEAREESEQELRSILSKHQGKSEGSKVSQLTKVIEKLHEDNYSLATDRKLELLKELDEAEK
jgi:thymidylate synthase